MMRAARLHGTGDVRLDEVPDPPDPGPTDVLVAPLWCGLCGTDAREYWGPGGAVPDDPHVLTGVHKPVVLGHEFSAEVRAVGSRVTSVAVGAKVAVYPLVGCRRCPECLRGEEILCPRKAWVGLSTDYGGLGDLVLLDEAAVSPLGDLDPALGAMIEPAAVALQAVRHAGVHAGDVVLVSGCGPIGILSVLAARALGASLVFANDPHPQRAAAAEAVGAVIVPLDPAEADGVIRQVAPEGVAASIDCAGKEGSLALCLAATRPGGTISVPAVHSAPPVVDIWRATRYVLRIQGSLGYTRDTWERTITLAASGAYPIGMLNPVRIDRDRVVEDGFEQLSGRSAAAKILVRVGATS